MKNKKIKLLLAITMLTSFALFLVSSESTISKKINYNSPLFSNSYFEYTNMNFSVNNKVSTPIISRQLKKEFDYLNKNRKTDINTPLLNLFDFKTKPTFVQNKNFIFDIELITTDDFKTFGEPIFKIYLKEGYIKHNNFLLKFSNVKKTNNKSWFELMGIKFTKTDYIVDVDYSNSNINNSVGIEGATYNGAYDFMDDIFPQLVNNNNLTISRGPSAWNLNKYIEEARLEIKYRILTLKGLKSDPYFAGLELAFAQEDFIFPNFNLYYKKPVEPPPPPPEPPIDGDNSNQNPDGPPEPQPEPTPPVNPDPQPDPQPEPPPEPTPPVNPEPPPDPQPEPPPEPTPPVNPDPQPEPDPIPPPEPQPDPPPAPDLNPEPQPTPEPNENSNLSVNNKMTTGLVMTLISACIMFIMLLLLIAVCSVKFDKKIKSKE